MTRAEISTLASSFLVNTKMAEEASLIRGEYMLDGNLAAIYYIEFSDNDISFDIDQFQEDHISSDYYNHPGYLQWNHYLIFIRQPDTVPLIQKNTIERNDIYTRKFVFTVEEFNKYFSYSFSTRNIESDIVSLWKAKLRAVDLDEVYSSNYYTEAIARFLNSDVQKEEVAEQSLPVSSEPVLSIDRISRISLRVNYRTHPKPNRSFDFTTANLVHGVNGSGKTSLLTAIELVIAGKTISDPSNPEPGNCIAATYNGQSEPVDEYTPNNNSKYRLRDNAWYSSPYTTGNELYRTFNRYNYFDSDAAYKLSFDEDNLNITKHLSAIALGPEFARMQDRMRGFEERLAKEYRTKEKAIEEQITRINDAQKTIDAIKEVTNPKDQFDLFLRSAQDIGWQATLPAAIIDETTGYEKSFQEATVLVATLEELMESAKASNLTVVREQLGKIAAEIKRVGAAKSLLDQAKQNTAGSKKIIDQSEKEADIISRAKVYFDNTDSFQFPAMQKNLSDLASQINLLKVLPDLYAEISAYPLLQSDESIQAAKERLNGAFKETNQTLAGIRQQYSGLKETLDQISGIVSDIKSFGKKYLLLNKISAECPLCETPFSNDDLLTRINNIGNSSEDNVALQSFNDEIIRLEGVWFQQQADLEKLSKIEQVIAAITPSPDYTTLTFIAFEAELKSKIESLAKNQQDEISLNARMVVMESLGISESSLLGFKIIFESTFPHIAFTPSSVEVFKKLHHASAGSLESARTIHNDNKNEEDRLKSVLTALQIELGIPDTETDAERYLGFKEIQFKKIEEQFILVQQFLAARTEDGPIEIKQNLSRLSHAFNAYRSALEDQAKINISKGIITEAKQLIEGLTPIITRIKTALEVLREILEKDKEANILADFLKDNEKDIEDIFMTLHTPKEFIGIAFDYESNTVSLKKRGVADPVPLNKISTGQRSALALSIFLALHKKVRSGPKILLFDDPVTYTDDLNILSFLDYLRNLVVKENRQIIFATANQKLAGLFEKKFAFLDNEMQTIPLERLV